MIITARHVVTPDGVLEPGWVRTEGASIAVVGAGAPETAPALPAPRLRVPWLVPGYVDLHMHGGGGHDVTTSPDALRGALRFHRAHGTAAALISLVTAPVDALCVQLGMVADLAESAPGVLGAHLEGPFLSAARCGAQNRAHMIPPDRQVAARLVDAARGHLRTVTLAPELPGADAVIDEFAAAGVVVAVGHTDAAYDAARRAFDRGATLATHLFNGMRPFHHREPGAVGAALDAGAYCELINDGVHAHAAVVRMVAAWRPDRLVLITDAVSAAGAPDGRYELSGQSVRVDGGEARLESDGALAGSTLTMDEAVRRAITDVGLDPRAVFEAASRTPAHVLGAEDRYGRIAPGARADLLGLDDDFRLVHVVSGGIEQPPDG